MATWPGNSGGQPRRKGPTQTQTQTPTQTPDLYISEMACSHRFQTKSTHITPPPPYGTKFWCFGQKLEKTLKKCEFAPCWQVMNVPERC